MGKNNPPTNNTVQDTDTLEIPSPNSEAVNDLFEGETESPQIPLQKQPSLPPQLPNQPRHKSEIPHEAPAGIQSGFVPSAAVETTYKVYKLKHGGKGNVGLHGEDDVVNPKTGRVERVRLVRGVPSIWSSEQKDLDRNYIGNNIRQLVFEDRTLRIASHDATALEFLQVCNSNVDNKNKTKATKYEIFEWNPRRQAEAAALKRQKRLEAIKAAMQQPFDVVRKHGSYLNIKFTDELGEPFDEAGLRNEYELKAEEVPEDFLNSLGSQAVDITYQVKRAIRDSRIDLGRQANQAFWTDGGFICQIPQNRESAAYLIELAGTNTEEGRAFKERLQIIMGK